MVHISFIKSAGSVAAAKEKTKGNKEKWNWWARNKKNTCTQKVYDTKEESWYLPCSLLPNGASARFWSATWYASSVAFNTSLGTPRVSKQKEHPTVVAHNLFLLRKMFPTGRQYRCSTRHYRTVASHQLFGTWSTSPRLVVRAWKMLPSFQSLSDYTKLLRVCRAVNSTATHSSSKKTIFMITSSILPLFWVSNGFYVGWEHLIPRPSDCCIGICSSNVDCISWNVACSFLFILRCFLAQKNWVFVIY